MAEDNFQTRLDGVEQGKATVVDVCRHYNKQEVPTEIPVAQLNEHAFFTKHFSKQLCDVLEFWFSDGSLDESQAETFRECAAFLLKLTKTQTNSRQWLKQQIDVINLSEKCLNEIGSYGYYIGIGGTEDPSLESFDWLIQALENSRCEQLLDTLAKCVSSRFYVEAFHRLHEVNALTLTITQNFLLVTCPNYILTCDSKKTHCLDIASRMLVYYNEIYAAFLPHIKEWTIPVILCLLYPVKFILSNIQSLAFEQKKLIYEIILTIILHKSTIDPNIEQVRVSLIHVSLCLLIEIIRSDQELAHTVKNVNEKKAELLSVLDDLSKHENNDQIKMKALELKSLLLPEEDFLKDNNTKEVIGLFVDNINQAVEDVKSAEVDEVLTGLKDLLQNDEVKQEIIKQNGLPSIIKYAKVTKDDPLPLEITYAMTFNGDAKKVINQDKEFVDQIKQLRESEKKDVSSAAHGIIWKLEGEEAFRRKQEEQTKAAEEKKLESSDKDSNKNDIMISYCWAQKALCHQVHDRLEADGYKVWLDRDEMHGSIIERMAEAIENSKFVLICMSNNYKNSTNCKAEAEYAFSRKSNIVPLIVEPKYKADGWLGFLAGSKIYVDFADKEDEEFEKAYGLLIDELKRNGLGEADADEKAKEIAPPPPEPEKPEEEPEPPVIQTREYLTVGPTSAWNNQHVLEFLSDNGLEQLRHACEEMDGPTLMEFCQSCQSLPDKLYALVNNPKEEHPVSLNTFFRFISCLKKFVPPTPPRKVYFQYDFIYPPANSAMDESKDAPIGKAKQNDRQP